MKSVLQEAHALRRQRQQSKWSKLVFNDSLRISLAPDDAHPKNDHLPSSTSATSSSSSSGTPVSLILVERVGETIGSIVWEGCAALMAFLLHQEKQIANSQQQANVAAAPSSAATSSSKQYTSLRSKRVLELGAGVGILGCLASKLGASEVLITDRQEILHVIRQNIQVNQLDTNTRPAELEWGNNVPDGLNPPFEVILASDVVYNLDAAWLLLDTLKAICDSETVVYLAYRQRDPKEQQWFEQAAIDFEFTTMTSALPSDWAQHFIFQSIADPTQPNPSSVVASSSSLLSPSLSSSSSSPSTSTPSTQTAAQRYQNEHRPLTIFRMQKKTTK